MKFHIFSLIAGILNHRGIFVKISFNFNENKRRLLYEIKWAQFVISIVIQHLISLADIWHRYIVNISSNFTILSKTFEFEFNFHVLITVNFTLALHYMLVLVKLWFMNDFFEFLKSYNIPIYCNLLTVKYITKFVSHIT